METTAVAAEQAQLPGVGRAGAGADGDARARIALSLLVEPGDAKIGALVAAHGPVEVAEALAEDRLDAGGRNRLRQAVAAQMARAESTGAVLLVPGSAGWPTQVDDLGAAAPLLLWTVGRDLRAELLRSVAMVGARACSPYGRATAETMAGDLALHSWTVVSGGAFGVDAAAHLGALAVGGSTVLVSAGGADRPYPRAHDALYDRVRNSGVLVSEAPLGSQPMRHRFLTRNRLIAALSRGTVLVEAALRSGARGTAAAAAALSRHVMAVPGPVTSDLSTGCHHLIREGVAVLVANSRDVLELITPLGEAPVGTEAREVLVELTARGPLGLSDTAMAIGRGRTETKALLVLLEGAGYVAHTRRGWAVSPSTLNRLARAAP